MRDRWSLCIVYLSLLGATACTSGDDVLLGALDRASDAGSDEQRDDASREAQQGTDADDYRSCKGDIAGKPGVELYVPDTTGAECMEDSCALHTEQMRTADDGSVWIAGSMDGRTKIWFGHFDSTGKKLGAQTLDSYGGAALLAVDEQQRGWVVTGDPEGSTGSRLYSFEPDFAGGSGMPVAGGISDMIRYPGHGILLSDYRHGLVAFEVGTYVRRFFHWRQAWASDTPPAGVLAVDDEGRIVRASRKQSDDMRSEWVVLDWFADGGAILPDRGPVQLGVQGSWLTGSPMIVAAGNQITVAYDSLPYPAGGAATRRIERVDETGAIQWRWQLSGRSADSSLAVDPVTGSVLTFSSDPDHGVVLVAISPDGESCRRFAIDGPQPYGFLALGPEGEIWFSVEDSFGSSFGRLERPDLRW